MISEFGIVLLFFILGFVFVGIGIFFSALIRPSKPTKEKLMTYECGEDPIGSPWIKFNPRFYLIALAFLIFEVEVVLLFPWVVVFKGLGWYAFWAMVIFVFILMLGLAYDWSKGYLSWDRPEPQIPKLKDLVITKED